MILISILLIAIILIVAGFFLHVLKTESEWLDSEIGETDAIDWNYDK